MKKLFLLITACFLILSSVALSTLIEVGVNEDIKSKVVSEFKSVSFNFVKFSTELYNTGSVPFNARARIFVYNNESRLIFNGWSQEKNLMPGEKKNFEIYWYANAPGEYETKLRIYYGNEINDSEREELEIGEFLASEDIFEINNFRTYDNYIVFDLKSNKESKNITIIPSRYILGWIFEQKTITEIKKGYIKTISINYYPTVWSPTTLTLSVVADNGRFYSEKTVEMKKQEGVFSVFYEILDSLKLIL